MISKIETLKEYDDQYYNDGISPISDDEYDILKEQAKEEFPNDPYFNQIGSEVSGDKIKLPYVLGSLEKKKIHNVEAWIDSNDGDIIASHKVDGVSIIVHYNNGKVAFAATRGDGYIGKDITGKARIFCPRIGPVDNVILRGDAIIKGNLHEDLGYSTRRNGTAGLLNRDDIYGLESMDVYFYEVIKAPVKLNTEFDRFAYIRRLGLDTPEFNFIDKDNALNYLLDMLKREDIKYDMDGIVLSVNDSEREDEYIPGNKVAFKVQGTPYKTKVRSVEWNVSRTRRIVPTVIIESVVIGGVTINRAAGHNAKYILDNNIEGGVEIELLRSGDVIPYIVSVTTSHSSLVDCPTKCPSCDSEVIWKGVDIVCTNTDCRSSVFKKMSYFLRELGAENITEKTLEKLNIDTIEKAYEIDEITIAGIEGFGIKRGEQIVSEILGTLTTTPEKLLSSFGISGIGTEVSRSIFKKYNFDDIFNVTYGEFSENIDGIGEILDKNLVDELPRVKITYNYLTSLGLHFKEENMESKIKGMQFALTGTMPIKRDILIKTIESKGGIVKSVSKKTDYVVTSDPTSGSGKLKKAIQYNIKIINFDELMEMLDE